jgi:predicted membrane protein
MSEIMKKSQTGIFLGLILIGIGGLILLKNLDLIHFEISRYIFSFPMFLLIIGSLIIVNSKKMLFGWLVTGFGAILMLERAIPEFHISKGIIFSVIIIVIGFYILVKTRKNESGPKLFSRKSETFSTDTIDDVSIFGGGEKTYNTNNFKGGNVTAIFGGSEIDLTSCSLNEGDNYLEVLAIFGGAEVHVPKSWNIVVDVVPIFGGVSNKTSKLPVEIKDMTRTLYVKGTVVFGGCEFKYH